MAGTEHPTGSSNWVATTVKEASARGRVAITGVIRSSSSGPHGSSVACRTVIEDSTGELDLLFLGRTGIPGFDIGRSIRVWGTAIAEPGGLVLWNPRYELLPLDVE